MPSRIAWPGSTAAPTTISSSRSSKRSSIARVGAILRRGGPAAARRGRSRRAAHRSRRRAASSYDGKPVALGATEFRLLEFLARNAGIALSRTQIVERIWDYDFDGSSNIVDVYVSQLRRKFEELGASGIIETVWGIGYRANKR